MTVVIGILALIGLAVVGASGWAFAQGVRDGLAPWRGAPPGGGGVPAVVPLGASPLSPAAVLPRSYQAGALAGEVAASWRAQSRTIGAAGTSGMSASSSWAAALALGSELSLQRQEAGRAMQAAMAQVLQDNEQAVRAAQAGASGASGGKRSTSDGGSGGRSGGGGATEMSDDGVRGGAAPDAGRYATRRGGSTSAGARSDAVNSGDGTGGAEAASRPTWPTHSPQRRPPQPRPTRCRQQRPRGAEERP